MPVLNQRLKEQVNANHCSFALKREHQSRLDTGQPGVQVSTEGQASHRRPHTLHSCAHLLLPPGCVIQATDVKHAQL